MFARHDMFEVKADEYHQKERNDESYQPHLHGVVPVLFVKSAHGNPQSIVFKSRYDFDSLLHRSSGRQGKELFFPSGCILSELEGHWQAKVHYSSDDTSSTGSREERLEEHDECENTLAVHEDYQPHNKGSGLFDNSGSKLEVWFSAFVFLYLLSSREHLLRRSSAEEG